MWIYYYGLLENKQKVYKSKLFINYLMGYNLSIPNISSKSIKVRDMVFSVLAFEYPLTAKKVYNRIKDRYKSPVTYQAVYKSIKLLEDEKCLDCSNNEYKINKSWITDMKKFIISLESAYENKKSLNIENANYNSLGKDVNIVNKWSYYSSEEYIFEMLQKTIKDSKTPPKSIFIHTHHLHHPLIYSFNLLNSIFSKYGNIYMLIKGNSQIDRWCKRAFEQNLNPKILLGTNCTNNIEYVIFGDVVIEIRIPSSYWKQLNEFYSRYKFVSTMDMQELYLLFQKNVDVQLIIYKNNKLANQLKEEMLSKFRQVIVSKNKLKFVSFDLNGVLTEENTIIELSKFTDNYELVKEIITNQTLGKKNMPIAFKEISKLIKGISLYDIFKYANKIKLMDGAKELLKKMKEKKLKLSIITTGFSIIANIINVRLGSPFYKVYSNNLEFVDEFGKVVTQKYVMDAIKKNDIITMKKLFTNGKIEMVINKEEDKSKILKSLLKDLGIKINQAAAVGDTMGDSDIINTCSKEGIGIVFNPNLSLLEYANHLIDKGQYIIISESKNLMNISDLFK